MKNIHYFLPFTLAATMLACGYQSEKSSSGDLDNAYESPEYAKMMEVATEEAYESSPAADVKFVRSTNQMERKVIKTANLNMQVLNLDSAKQNIDKIVRQYNAYASADNRNNDHYRLSLEMTIRVEQEQMETMLQKLLEQASYVHYNNINAQDVTDEFVDLNIRLKNKKAVEEQYVKLLQKANKVEDILKVENELRLIREEIEAKEGRLNFLKSQVNMSTIHLMAYQDIYEVNKAPAKSYWLKIKDGFSGGWNMLKEIVVGLIYIWPILLVIGLLIPMIIRRIKRYRIARNA